MLCFRCKKPTALYIFGPKQGLCLSCYPEALKHPEIFCKSQEDWNLRATKILASRQLFASS